MSCLRPKVVRVNGQLTTVMCGKCPSCSFNRTAGWTHRLLQEDRFSLSSHFITLTYDNSHLVSSVFGRPSLCKYDLQCFFKRLRRRQAFFIPGCSDAYVGSSTVYPIKYYAVGEYGGQTKRPHYHIILFNADIDTIESAWCRNDELIGSVYYGDVCGASIGYTLKYLSKSRTAGKFGDDDRHPEFSVMSKGLGLSYVTELMKSFHHADFWNRNFITLPGQIKSTMPRYYYERIYDGYQRDLLKMSGSLCRQDDFYCQFVSQSYEERMENERLFQLRVDGAFARQDYQNSQLQKL